MRKQQYRYLFVKTVSARDIEESLMLALIATESLHGLVRLKMDGRYRLDKKLRLCEIDATTPVGIDLAKIFAGYVTREYGDASVTIKQETSPERPTDKCSCAAKAKEDHRTSQDVPKPEKRGLSPP